MKTIKNYLMALLLLGATTAGFTACSDDDMEHSPVAPLPTAISNYLTENYPNAKIVEVDVEDDRDDPDYGCVEVDIIHDGISKEVFFNAQHAWVLSRWEVPVASLPQVVKDAVNGRYAGYVIDDAGFIKSAEKGAYYLLELEKDGVADVHVEVGEDGIFYAVLKDRKRAS